MTSFHVTPYDLLAIKGSKKRGPFQKMYLYTKLNM